LHGWEDDVWDLQMKRDLAGGKMRKLLAKVDADIQASGWAFQVSMRLNI
jgi:hypothetical protein